MTVVTYDPLNGICCPDGEVEEVARSLIGTTDKVIGTEILVLALRTLRRSGEIKDLKFIYDGKTLQVGEQGKMETWPEGFCEVMEDLYGRLAWVTR